MTRRILAVFLASVIASSPALAEAKQREVKIQKSSISRDQEIDLGKQAAAEVEKALEVVKNREIEAWLNKIGQKLAQTPQANNYPYYFKLINEDSINAFALPGGPMYVHTGLIKAADNEGQVVGVLAHEMSHVALRHGVSQMSKQNTWKTILGVAGAAAGMAGGGGLIGQAVNIGGGLGVASLLGKFSRDAERDADLNGARMAAAAGYNPVEVARFFEKLEAEMGKENQPKGLEAWLSSHPNPGRRVEYVTEDIRFLPPAEYNADSGQFARIQKLVAKLPPPKKKPAAQQTSQGGAQPRQGLPAGFRDFQTKDFAVAYPDGWQAGQPKQGGSLYIVPQGGVARSQNGGIELIAGAMIDYFRPQSGQLDLNQSTEEFLRAAQQSDPSMRVENPQQIRLGGQPALMTRLTTRTSFQQDPEQIVYLFTVARPNGLWMMALASPVSRARQAEPIFRSMTQTVQFADQAPAQ
jgi:Zn-dependent protease with chaperone function